MVQTGPGCSFFLLTIGGGACDPQKGSGQGSFLERSLSVSEEEAVPLTTGFAGPGGQPPRAHNAPRGPRKVAGWVPGPAVESLSPSPGSLPVATLPVVLGSKYLRVDIAGQRFTGPRGGAAGRSRSRSLTEGPVTIECKGDTSFVFRDRSLSACIYHVRN